MGSEWDEAKSVSPERLTILRITDVGDTEEGITLSVTFRYEPWCCNGSHELVNAVQSIENAISESTQASYDFRMAKLAEEYAPLREQLRLELSGSSETED